MIKIEPIKVFPKEIEAAMKAEVHKNFAIWALSFDKIVRMSPRAYLVREGEKPLLALGAFRLTPLSTEAELWLFPSHHFGVLHVPDCARMFRNWLEDYSGPNLFARTFSTNRPKRRFIEWFGGHLVSDDGRICTYEVSP